MTTGLDTLATKTPGPRWQECTVAYALRTLPADKRRLLRAALDNDSVEHAEIARALRSEGIHVTGQTVGRHRAGDCRCENNR